MFWSGSAQGSPNNVFIRVELLPCFKFTGKMVKIKEFTGKIGKAGKR
jgi:hypothetical protein